MSPLIQTIKNNPAVSVLYTGAAATSVVSFVSSVPFLSNEMGLTLGITSAAVLGITMYSGWDLLFNEKGFWKKALGASLASLALVASIGTIYQMLTKDDITQQQTTQINNNTQRQKDWQTKHDLLVEQKTTATNNKAALQAELKTAQTELRTLSQASENNPSKYKFRHQRRTLEANIKQAKATIKGLKADIKTKEANYNAAADALLKETAKPATITAKIDPLTEIDIAKLIQASITDLATFFLLLIARAYRAAKEEEDSEHVNNLKATIKKANALLEKQQRHIIATIQQTGSEAEEKGKTAINALSQQKEQSIEELNTAKAGANKAIANMKKQITRAKNISTSEPNHSDLGIKLGIDTFFDLLKEEAIKPSPSGNLTVGIIAKAIGHGEPTASKYIEEALNIGKLIKKGRNNVYPEKRLDQIPLEQTCIDNVTLLRPKNHASSQ